MLWKVVGFLKDKSVAAVPISWIRKYKKRYFCYWPKSNAESLRKKLLQPALKKNEKNMYECEILVNDKTFCTFKEALAAELSLTVSAPKKHRKAPYNKSQEEKEQKQIIQEENGSGVSHSIRPLEVSADITEGGQLNNVCAAAKDGHAQFEMPITVSPNKVLDFRANEKNKICVDGSGPGICSDTDPSASDNIGSGKTKVVTDLSIAENRFWKKKILEDYNNDGRREIIDAGEASHSSVNNIPVTAERLTAEPAISETVTAESAILSLATRNYSTVEAARADSEGIDELITNCEQSVHLLTVHQFITENQMYMEQSVKTDQPMNVSVETEQSMNVGEPLYPGLSIEPLTTKTMSAQKPLATERTIATEYQMDVDQSVNTDEPMIVDQLSISEPLNPEMNIGPLTTEPMSAQQPLATERTTTTEYRMDVEQSLNTDQPMIVDQLSISEPLHIKSMVNQKPPITELPRITPNRIEMDEPLITDNRTKQPINLGEPLKPELNIGPLTTVPMSAQQPLATERTITTEYRMDVQQSVNTDQPMIVDQLSISEPLRIKPMVNQQPPITELPRITPNRIGMDEPLITDNRMKRSVIGKQIMNAGEPSIPGVSIKPLTTESMSVQHSLASERTIIVNNPMDMGQSAIYDELKEMGEPLNAEPFISGPLNTPMFTQQSLIIEHPFIAAPMINESLITNSLISEPMVNFGDYLDLPVIGMNYDLGFTDCGNISEPIGLELEQHVECDDTTTENDLDDEFFAALDSLDASEIDGPKLVSHQTEELSHENSEHEEMSALENVINFLTKQGNQEFAPEVSYVLKPNSDGSVEIEMIGAQNDTTYSEKMSADGDGHASPVSGEPDSVVMPTPDQQQQQNVVTECRIEHLGSNNYRDSQCYLYTKNNLRKSNLYLRCKNSVKYQCPARVTVRDNLQDAEMTIHHNHPPDKQLVDRQIFDKKLEQNIDRDPFQTPRQVYLSTKKDLLNIIDTTHIPLLKKMEGFIYRRQRKFVPMLPSTVEEFEKYIEDDRYRESFTKDQRGLPYFRGVWTSKKGERNLVFISETTLKVINTKMNHVSFFMDGTYRALPHHIPFRQLYVISLTYENQCYPLAYIFMEKKTFTAYDTIFQNLKFLMPSVEVVKLMTDYEAATRKALKKHYPNARIAGCFFHYVQAMVKSTKRFGLRSDDRFTDAIKKICHLALLPNEFVVQGFESINTSLSSIESTRWDRFRKYWMKQWGKANISVYGLGDRSNNFSESNNKSLNLLNMKQHPNIWQLIKNLKLLEMDKSDKINRAVLGEIFEVAKSNDAKAFDKKVVSATALFNEDQDVSRFLERATYGVNVELFVKNQVNIMDHSSDADIDDEDDEEVIANDYDRESDFRKNHPREAVSRRNEK